MFIHKKMINGLMIQIILKKFRIWGIMVFLKKILLQDIRVEIAS